MNTELKKLTGEECMTALKCLLAGWEFMEQLDALQHTNFLQACVKAKSKYTVI